MCIEEEDSVGFPAGPKGTDLDLLVVIPSDVQGQPFCPLCSLDVIGLCLTDQQLEKWTIPSGTGGNASSGHLRSRKAITTRTACS